MVTKDPKAPKAEKADAGGRGKASGRGRGKGDGKGRGKAATGTLDTARRLQELDGHSVEAESNFEILRAQRAQARRGHKQFKDIRENEGVDEDDPLNSIDDGIRLEPFNMRREMREGHFDESGFYVLNKGVLSYKEMLPTSLEGCEDEEKKVTDAWLDTVDQAERTATFMAAEKQNTASTKAATRLSAMAKNLGPDSEGEDEEDKDEKDEQDEEEKKKEEEAKAKAQAEEQEEDKEEEETTIISMLEELVTFLQPLETPAAALARVRRGTATATAPALKTRARLRQSRQEVARAAVAAQDMEAEQKPKRKKLNEWGVYEEGAEKDAMAPRSILMEDTPEPPAAAPAPVAPAVASTGEVEKEKEDVTSKVESTDATMTDSVDSELAKAEAARAAAAAAVKAEQLQAAERAKEQAQNSSVTNPEAVAEAAARAADEERAATEAAKAFAAEMKMSRNIARALVPEQGPEAAAIVNLNSEETRDVREKAMPKAPEEQPADGPPRPGKRQKVSQTDAELEKREKINRLTDLCDRLLERGVLVYDSARELLAIDVRQRKEQLAPEDGAPAAPEAPAVTTTSPTATAPVQEVQYTNKRFKATDATSAVTELTDVKDVAIKAVTASLFWQFRWGHNLDEINGPFDSVTMQGWVLQGCFSEERPAEERNEPQEQCWHRWDKIDFELYI